MKSNDAPLITLIAVCKPFKGHINLIQRNAIRSWTRHRPYCDVILFGNEEGIESAASDLGVRHMRDVGRNEYGTPLLNDLFARAKAATQTPLLGYINCDIMLMSDFVRALQRLRGSRFLMSGQRWNTDITEPWNFDAADWETPLRELVRTTATQADPAYIDYFIFDRSMYAEIPPLALGRAAFDNWMIFNARSVGAKVIDATDAVMAVHQNHDYGHHQGGYNAVYTGPEAQENRRLAGADQWGDAFLFTLRDATWKVTETGLRPILHREAIQRHVVTAPVLYPSVRPAFRAVKRLRGIRDGALRRMRLLPARKG